jgi:plastocyanin
MRLSKLITALALVCAPIVLAACGGAAASDSRGNCTPIGAGSANNATATQLVRVVADPTTLGAFEPKTITVSAGQSVTWTFQEQSMQHSVTADDGTFDSCLHGAGFTFAVTFAKAGTYAYHCSIHAQMTGRVIVSGPGASGASAHSPS